MKNHSEIVYNWSGRKNTFGISTFHSSENKFFAVGLDCQYESNAISSVLIYLKESHFEKL